MLFSNFKDKALYLRLKQKDREGFIKAYDLYVDDIYRFVFFKTGNREEAEDITSLVFLRCWEYLQQNAIKDYKTLKSLFYKVARNLIIDHYRRKSLKTTRESSIDRAEIIDEETDMIKKLETASDLDLVRKKLFLLKDEYREAIILSFINELSVSEISLIMGKSKGNIRVLIYRALNALKDLVNEDENKQ